MDGDLLDANTWIWVHYAVADVNAGVTFACGRLDSIPTGSLAALVARYR